MADTVNTTTIRNSNGNVVRHFTNESDGTGESAVTKIDISTFTDSLGRTGEYAGIQFIDWQVNGMNYVTLEFVVSGGTNDELAVLKGNGFRDYTPFGCLADPLSDNGGTSTGDIVLTTDGATDGSSYDILIGFKVKVS